MKLYSYTLRYDSGAAPNPFWGICTLAICKPAIRLAAEVDDWIVGLGSTKSPIGDISDHVVYAMKVTSKMTLEEYDQFCKTFVPKKKPDWRNRDYRMRMGDCIYNYIAGSASPKMRTGVHIEENMEKDLSGLYALVSKQYYYFGDKPVKLPDELRPIMHTTQGHKSDANQEYVEPFVNWIESLDIVPNKVIGEPQLKKQYMLEKELQAICSMRDAEEDE
jgi:hypothetical protein